MYMAHPVRLATFAGTPPGRHTKQLYDNLYCHILVRYTL